MGHGPALRTKLKKELLATEGVAIALEQAKEQIALERASRPFNRKKLIASASTHLGKFIDKLDADSIIKLSAWIGGAVILKPMLQSLPDVAAAVTNRMIDLASLTNQISLVWVHFDLGFMQQTVQEAADEAQKNELFWWLLALLVSAYIVMFGPEIIKSFGGLGKLAVGLFA